MNLLKAAKEGGTTTAFDFNYRAKLWSPQEATETLTQFFPGIDVLVIAARDAQDVLGLEGDPRQIAHNLGSQYDFETVIVTRGSEVQSAGTTTSSTNRTSTKRIPSRRLAPATRLRARSSPADSRATTCDRTRLRLRCGRTEADDSG